MCFAPQQRAIFHLSSGQTAPHPPLQRAYFSTLRSHKSLSKHSVSRLSHLFAHLDLLSSEAFSFWSSFFFSSLVWFFPSLLFRSLTSKLPLIRPDFGVISHSPETCALRHIDASKNYRIVDIIIISRVHGPSMVLFSIKSNKSVPLSWPRDRWPWVSLDGPTGHTGSGSKPGLTYLNATWCPVVRPLRWFWTIVGKLRITEVYDYGIGLQ